MRTVLLTGFGPFPGAPHNPSGPLVRRLARVRRPALAECQLVSHVFATTYQAVDHELPDLLARYRPAVLLMFGLASSTRHIRIETRARNVLAGTPDAAGFAPLRYVFAGGGRRHLPIKGPRMMLLRAARSARVPARLSRDAGHYLCNYLYWRALEAAAKPQGPRVAVFVHIPPIRRPPTPRRRPRRCSQNDLVRAAEAILTASVAALNRTARP